jgi:hypothetical protein
MAPLCTIFSIRGLAHSSSGLGHRPLKAETTGSNPVCATKLARLEMAGFLVIQRPYPICYL